MATFCLVHSSVQGPSGWALLADALEDRGHRAIMPDLGDVDPDSGSLAYAEVIADAVEKEIVSDETRLWLLAHSASGLFLPWIPHLIPDMPIAGLIYLAAYAPLSGESLLSTLAADPGMFNPAWLGKDPMDDEIAREFLFHDCSEPVLGWALSTRRLMVARHAMSELLPAGMRPTVPARYIACRHDRTLAPEWMRRAARERLGVEAIEIDGDHCPQVSRPAELAGVLDTL
ncbi:alpha/beta hydrolase [Sphingomonas sp. BE138]|uniref:alpha/beta hydrolase n=1 Tax=Sphingomonas sp. BE138 TaxID=2817845 RepID=UPI00286B5478|nr:alpha/beta hydrolase [Sphingomonas sp. BE138]